jgi:hypothetical protein
MVEDARHLVGAPVCPDPGHHVPGAALEHEAEGLDDALPDAFQLS